MNRETNAPRARYAADLLKVGVRLPLTVSDECHATLVDADGRDVLTVDLHRQRSDDEACKIALWIALAVNTCGGYALDTSGKDQA
ncbi:hypothetical protein [Shinella pollutisoli]|uniref:Uncharacterized protein n=1 Tax=Shinella pollutisoli TaxID=2250594 RepID=A0ABV7DK79_9HYPH|nr:hypothetical protein [Shinella pollutisoli]